MPFVAPPLGEVRAMKRVFMFEADVALVEALRLRLAEHDCVLEASDEYNSGLERLESNPADLIVISVEFPGKNGFAICNQLRKHPRFESSPLIILSSDATDETFEHHRKLRVRADAYFRKPFDLSNLLKVMSVYLDFDSMKHRGAQTSMLQSELSSSLPGKPPKRLKSLIFADSSSTIRTAAALALAGEDLQLRLFDSGEAIAKTAARKRPDAVVVSVDLSGRDGYEVCRQIRANEFTRKLPVILLWGASTPFDAARGEASGATHSLRKPFDTEHMLAMLHAVLNGFRPPAPEGPLLPSVQNPRTDMASRDSSPLVLESTSGTEDYRDLFQNHEEDLVEFDNAQLDDGDLPSQEVEFDLDEPSQSATTKIIWFESDEDLVDELRGHLEEYDCELDVVTDGILGLASVAHDPPDLILITVELPGVSGFTICNDLKKSPTHSSIPIILISTNASDQTFELHRRLRSRAEAYFKKPFLFHELLATIAELILLRPKNGLSEESVVFSIADGAVVQKTERIAAPAKIGPPPTIDAEESTDDVVVELDGSVEVDPLVNEQWLVVLWSDDPTIRGRRYNISHMGVSVDALIDGAWTENLVTVGRSGKNKVVVADPRVSSWHFRIQLRDQGFVLEDLESVNGTFVDDKRVDEIELHGGETIRIGGTIMKFVNDIELASSFAEVIREFSETDWPTGTLQRHVFKSRLQTLATEASAKDRPLSLVAVGIDDIRSVSCALGDLTVDRIVEGIAQMTKEVFAGHPIGRNVGAGFLVALQNKAPEQVLSQAEKLRAEVEGCSVVFDRVETSVTASLGVVELAPGEELDDTLRRANALVSAAQDEGGNRVLTAAARPQLECMLTRPQQALPTLMRAMSSPTSVPLVAFEIGGERDVVHHYGREGYSRFSSALIDAVAEKLHPGDRLAQWLERYTIVALRPGHDQQSFIHRVEDSWESLDLWSELAMHTPPQLRHTTCQTEPGFFDAEETLNMIIDGLARAPSDEASASEHLPIVPTPSWIESHSTPDATLDAAERALELALVFSGALLAAAGLRSDNATRRRSYSTLLDGAPSEPIRLLTDQSLLIKLAKLAREDEGSPVAALGAYIASRPGKRLLRRITDMITRRLDANERDDRDKRIATEAKRALRLVSDVNERLGDQLDVELFTVEAILGFGPEETIDYELQLLGALTPPFPSKKTTLSERLTPTDDLVFARINTNPKSVVLDLSPTLRAARCPTCGRLELFFSPTLPGSPAKPDYRGILTDHALD